MSSKKQLDALGDRMKLFERLETEHRLIPNLPIYVRLDGRGFSNFTRKMKRPYDSKMSTLMLETTKYLVSEFQANIGYVQSDEISLVITNNYENPCIFEGKVQKLVSTLAASASAFFISKFQEVFGKPYTEYSKRIPTFDCRIFNLPSESEAANAILWRYLDAKKNSVQMLAQSLFSHKELQGLHTSKLLDKMLVEKNVDWNTYPEYFKTGSFAQRTLYTVDIPKEHLKDPNVTSTIRSKISTLELEPLHLMSHSDIINIIFNTK